MLQDLLEALRDAKTEKEIERAYKNLEKVGMDRITARLLVKEIYEET